LQGKKGEGGLKTKEATSQAGRKNLGKKTLNNSLGEKSATKIVDDYH